MFNIAGQQFETEDDLKAALFKVEAKDAALVSFKPNPTQLYLRAEMKRQNARRVVITKFRQGGITTWTLVEFFYKLLTQAPSKAAIISHEAESTQRLLDKVKVLYANLPPWFKPPIYHNSDNEMSWPSIGSSIYVGTAGARAFGRGDTFNWILMSEYAHWTVGQAAKIRLGLQESCPASGIIIIECSPNGEGNEHHLLYLQAKSGESPYKAVFLPWFVNKVEYSLPPGHALALESSKGQFAPTVLEEMLIQQHGLTLDNIRWRRSKIAGFAARPEVGNDTALAEMFFKQEYPEDDTSCFISLSQTMFAPTEIARMQTGTAPPKFVDIEGTEWWHMPLATRAYVVACDPATVWGADNAVILGYDITDYPRVLHVATWVGKVSDDLLGRKIVAMATRLNNAQVIIESTGIGQSVLNMVVNVLRYSQVFYQPDPFQKLTTLRPGWYTTKPSKAILVQEGLRVINGGYLQTADSRLVSELQYFRHDQATDSFEAAPGHHDDFVMATLLAFQAALTAPRALLVGKRSHNYGWDW